MSIVNFHVEPDRILIAVDTIAANDQGQYHVNKMFPIPHTNMIVCGRGCVALIARAALHCSLMSGGLDEIKAMLPEHLIAIAKTVKIEAWFHRVSRTAINSEQEVYVFGWSESAGEMTALRFFRAKGQKQFTTEDDIVENIAPAMDNGKFPAVHDRYALMYAAQGQLRECLSKSLLCIGGNLVMAELRRNTMSIEQMGPIDKTNQKETP